MEKLITTQNLYKLYSEHQLLIMFGVMIFSFYPLSVVLKNTLFPIVNKLIDKKGKKYQIIFEKHKLSSQLNRLFLTIYLVVWLDIIDKSNLITSVSAIRMKDIAITTYIIFAITSFLLVIINISVDFYNVRKLTKKIAVELHTQILKIIIVTCAILAFLALVLGISISSLFTSIGAAAALLMLVFKDTVLGLITSLQLTFQNIIQVGDWVTLPQYNADGDIQKITISVVVIRNFDNTYTTVPTSAFLTTGVKNWRPMFELGGRRIKRAISLDMDTIKICDQNELDIIKKMPYMSMLVKEKSQLFSAESQATNLSMFRHYVTQYLESNQKIHKEGFTFLVRALDPTPKGIPIEVYVFTNDTRWVNYEEIQADIFEHLLGILPIFKLRAFQSILRS